MEPPLTPDSSIGLLDSSKSMSNIRASSSNLDEGPLTDRTSRYTHIFLLDVWIWNSDTVLHALFDLYPKFYIFCAIYHIGVLILSKNRIIFVIYEGIMK